MRWRCMAGRCALFNGSAVPGIPAGDWLLAWPIPAPSAGAPGGAGPRPGRAGRPQPDHARHGDSPDTGPPLAGWPVLGTQGGSPLSAAEARHQPGDQGGQEDLAGHRLQHGNGLTATVGRGVVSVTERGQRGKAEVLEGLCVADVAVREERAPVEVGYRGIY